MAKYRNTKKKEKLPFSTDPRYCNTIEQCENAIEELMTIHNIYREKDQKDPDGLWTRYINARKKLIKLQSKAGYYWLLYVLDKYRETYTCWGIFKHYSTAEYYEKDFQSKRTSAYIVTIKLNYPELLPWQNEKGSTFIVSINGGETFNLDWSAISEYNALKLANHLLKKNIYKKGVTTVEISQGSKIDDTRENYGKIKYLVKDSLNNEHTIVIKSLLKWDQLPEIVYGTNNWKPEVHNE